jgi:hypothetical protein
MLFQMIVLSPLGHCALDTFPPMVSFLLQDAVNELSMKPSKHSKKMVINWFNGLLHLSPSLELDSLPIKSLLLTDANG